MSDKKPPSDVTVPPIPELLALRICSQIQAEIRGKLYSWMAWRCWGCVQSARGDPHKLYFACQADNRGCPLLNERLEEFLRETSQN